MTDRMRRWRLAKKTARNLFVLLFGPDWAVREITDPLEERFSPYPKVDKIPKVEVKTTRTLPPVLTHGPFAKSLAESREAVGEGR